MLTAQSINRDIVLNNWLLNPTGNPNSWVEMDLAQEHLNFWVKVSNRSDYRTEILPT